MAEGVHARSTVHLVACCAAAAALATSSREGDLRWLRAHLGPRVSPVAPRSAGGPLPESAPSVAATPPPPAPAAPGAPPQHPVIDPCVAWRAGRCARRALAGFDAAVARGGVVRVAHLGDSIVADDKVTARLRERLQSRLGDGGPGFVYASPPSRWYHHRDVTLDARGWHVRSVVANRADDGRHGYGGARFDGEEGARTRISLRRPADRVELFYDRAAARGALALRIGVRDLRVETRGESGEGSWAGELAPSETEIVLRAEGPARIFGIAFERHRGAVVDNLGLVGNSARALLATEEGHARRALAQRAPQLVVVLLGANEAIHAWEGARFEEGFRALLRRVRGSGADCLVMAPPDVGVDDGGRVTSRPLVRRIVEAERRAALAEGCAFWNTWAFMGGAGSVASWRRWSWVEPDLIHPTAGGGARIADALVDALFSRRAEAP